MKVAVVGCGNVSVNHFAALKEIEDAEIIATVDIKPDRADKKAQETGAKAYYSYDEMLEKEKPDVIHIATPHYLHTSMAIKALEHGADVFLEKPCSVTKEEADALIKAQAKYGRQVAVCFQNRYNDSSVAMKQLIDGGTLGKIKGIRAFVTWSRGEDYYSDDWHGTKDKECGGVLINQSIHTMDLVQWFGGGCRAVTAHAFNDHLKGIIEVEDTATVLMEMKDGIPAVFYATLAYSGNSDVFIEASMENGTLRLEKERLYLLRKGEKPEEICQAAGGEFTGKNYWGYGHRAIIKDFYDCLRTGRHFTIDAGEGAKAAKIVAACYESSDNNKKVEVI